MIPKSAQITERLVELLRTVTRDNGFFTDIGRNVTVSGFLRNQHEVPGCELFAERETVAQRYSYQVRRASYEIVARTLFRETPIKGYMGPPEDYVIQECLIEDLFSIIKSDDLVLQQKTEGISYTGTEKLIRELGVEIVMIRFAFDVDYSP